jgi:hypothetical protein
VEAKMMSKPEIGSQSGGLLKFIIDHHTGLTFEAAIVDDVIDKNEWRLCDRDTGDVYG